MLCKSLSRPLPALLLTGLLVLPATVAATDEPAPSIHRQFADALEAELILELEMRYYMALLASPSEPVEFDAFDSDGDGLVPVGLYEEDLDGMVAGALSAVGLTSLDDLFPPGYDGAGPTVGPPGPGGFRFITPKVTIIEDVLDFEGTIYGSPGGDFGFDDNFGGGIGTFLIPDGNGGMFGVTGGFRDQVTGSGENGVLIFREKRF